MNGRFLVNPTIRWRGREGLLRAEPRGSIAVPRTAGIGALPPFTGTAAKYPLPPIADLRVESRMGAVPRERSVSHPRSSNWTCGFPASSFPTGLIVRPTAVIQRQNSKTPEDQVAGESLGSAAWYLMPPTEEMSDASADVMINCRICPASCSITEVGRPAAQQVVQPVAHFGPWPHIAWHQHFVDLRLHPLDTFLGWTCTQVPVAVPLVAMRTERVPEEVEALRSCVLHRGFPLVERQPELRHHHLCPRQRLSRASLTEDDELSSGGESHPSALSDPDVRLSPHPAPTRQPPAARRASTEQIS